jgi:transcriptional regulator with XRE-family HTH domain
MDLTVIQCRAARALLGWTAAEVAGAAGIGIMTVKRFEGGQKMNASSVAKLKAALEEAGIRFISAGGSSPDGGEGVRLGGNTAS